MPEPMIEFDQLSFRSDQRYAHVVLNNICFSVQKGERVAIIGNNGSGKSTLAKLLVGLLTPQLGKIYIKGIELNDSTKWDIRKHIGLVFQNPENQFIGSTVQDDIAFGLENLNMSYENMKKRVDHVLEIVGMSSFRMNDPSRLSGGQKQRVAIASVLALKPKIIILDEALVMLDPKSRRELLNTLQHIQTHENITIVSITHDMDEAVEADRIILMENGTITKIGSPDIIFTNFKSLHPPFTERLRQTFVEKNRQVPQTFMSEGQLVNWL